MLQKEKKGPAKKNFREVWNLGESGKKDRSRVKGDHAMSNKKLGWPQKKRTWGGEKERCPKIPNRRDGALNKKKRSPKKERMLLGGDPQERALNSLAQTPKRP